MSFNKSSKSKVKNKRNTSAIKSEKNRNNQAGNFPPRSNDKYKRAITDNHHRYSEPSEEFYQDEDDGTIITHENIRSSLTLANSSSYLRFDECEKEWDKIKDNQFSSVMKINLSGLAKSLETIPLHTLLKIDDADFMPYITLETHQSTTTSQSNIVPVENVESEELKKENENSSLGSKKRREKIKESSLHIKLSNIDSRSYAIEDNQKENEELDQLLALDELDLQEPAVNENVISDDVPTNPVAVEQIPNVSANSEPEEITTVASSDNDQVSKKESVDDLESWLDSIID
ncbi:uncharacterized protein TRIADDRAFT_57295 [Trichoplax adhaerens]|uniref:Cell death regulator Aven n=1 Tax=Trichoplax adhaerens TaxID=10228 RepID=B3RZ18_TRIAD|nr:predicted protein [Trichoplax adhaerens]EDV23766.1 predicted protein [Trichoplax adhaerens]|eukprot:XP_002113292.1 predicted protein [Trichoplax adhaerens]